MGSIEGYTMGFGHSTQFKTLNLFDERPCSMHAENPGSRATVEDNHTQGSLVSDCESAVSGTENRQEERVFKNGLIRIHEEDKTYGIIKNKFVSSLSSCGLCAEVEAMHRRVYSGIMSQAKFQTFCIYVRAMEQSFRGGPNGKYAWYGASKKELIDILPHGFGHTAMKGIHSQGICLSSADHPIGSLQSSVPDEDGLRHVLLCRVLLGRTEIVRPDSGQCNPSSEEFDSGVDNLTSPRKYIVWSTHMNTHILPEYLLSFRISNNSEGEVLSGHQRTSSPLRRPSSAFIPFADLIKALTKLLPPDAIKTITKHYADHKEKKMTRHELIERLRNIAGDRVLLAVVKSHMDKMKIPPRSFLPNYNPQRENPGLQELMMSLRQA